METLPFCQLVLPNRAREPHSRTVPGRSWRGNRSGTVCDVCLVENIIGAVQLKSVIANRDSWISRNKTALRSGYYLYVFRSNSKKRRRYRAIYLEASVVAISRLSISLILPTVQWYCLTMPGLGAFYPASVS